jgi:peptide/nickel transport system permease protein
MKHQQKLRVALILLACFHGFVFFAGFFAPYGFADQNRERPFAPPTRMHVVDDRGKFHFRPFVYSVADTSDNPAGVAIDPPRVYPIHFLVRGAPYKIAGLFSARVHLFGVEEPGKIFLLGTDAYGRDQFSRFLYGGQISLLAGLLAAALSVSLGTAIGAAAGFYGGRTDEFLMRVAELFLASPWLYLLFAVRAALPLHIAEWQVFLLLVVVLGLIGWARPARLIRGVVLSAKERHFVLAARGFGASDGHLLRRHVLPQTYGVILTQMTLLIPQYVLAEVTLTFLGLGVGEPMPSWGNLLAYLQQYSVLVSYWWMFIPALLLVPIFLAYYLAADALQEHFQSVPL